LANTKIQRMKKDIPEVFDFINKHITEFETNLNYAKLSENLKNLDEKNQNKSNY